MHITAYLINKITHVFELRGVLHNVNKWYQAEEVCSTADTSIYKNFQNVYFQKPIN